MRLEAHDQTCDQFDPEPMTEFQRKFRDAPVCLNEGTQEKCGSCRAKKFAARPPRETAIGRALPKSRTMLKNMCSI